MASNPYGITQVDVPGLLGMHSQLKRQRLEDLYTQKKVEREDREFEREERKAGVMAKLFASQKESDSAPAADTATEAEPTPQAPPARADGLRINPDALRELATIDPEMAVKFSEFAAKADKADLERVAAHGEVKALAAKRLLQFPAGEARMQEFERIKPDLMARGFSEQDLAAADLSDAILSKDVTFGMSLKDLVSQEDARAREAESRRRWEVAEARAARNEGRAAVRFEERDLDRQALSGRLGVGGRSLDDTSDLDY